jgi:hypothetical protein
MDKLDAELVKRIEDILSVKFEPWQINYLNDIPMVLDMRITGRGTGKTLVYIIKLLFVDEKPIKLYDSKGVADLSDDFSYNRPTDRFRSDHYTKYFRNYLNDIYRKLSMGGIHTRPVLYNKEGETW